MFDRLSRILLLFATIRRITKKTALADQMKTGPPVPPCWVALALLVI
jgi:hypothetical protein